MAKAKGGKKDNKKKVETPDNGAPKTITMKGGLTKNQLVAETLFKMEDNLRVSKAEAKDFVESLLAVIDEQLSEGSPVNLFGLVKISPRLHTKGVREVNSIFGDSTSPKVKKKYPAKVSVKVAATKAIKDSLPSVQKLAKKVG